MSLEGHDWHPAPGARSAVTSDHTAPPSEFGARRGIGYRDPAPFGGITFRGWCNWQHSWFWSSHWGFESSPPSANKIAAGIGGVTKPPSSSGLGHHPLKVAARVRIPLGVLDTKPLVSSRERCTARGFGVSGPERLCRPM